jgi:hypothetical protein
MTLHFGKYRLMIRLWKFEVTKPMADWIFKQIHWLPRLAKMDNKELLHHLLRIGVQSHLDADGELFWGELEDRLFPEYDGDNIEHHEWGWKYKNGEHIVYHQELVPQGGIKNESACN